MTLPDLREPIAEILEALASYHIDRDPEICTLPEATCSAAIQQRGAQTLRWLRDIEYGVSTDDLRDEIDALRSEIEQLPSHEDLIVAEERADLGRSCPRARRRSGSCRARRARRPRAARPGRSVQGMDLPAATLDRAREALMVYEMQKAKVKT